MAELFYQQLCYESNNNSSLSKPQQRILSQIKKLDEIGSNWNENPQQELLTLDLLSPLTKSYVAASQISFLLQVLEKFPHCSWPICCFKFEISNKDGLVILKTLSEMMSSGININSVSSSKKEEEHQHQQEKLMNKNKKQNRYFPFLREIECDSQSEIIGAGSMLLKFVRTFPRITKMIIAEKITGGDLSFVEACQAQAEVNAATATHGSVTFSEMSGKAADSSYVPRKKKQLLMLEAAAGNKNSSNEQVNDDDDDETLLGLEVNEKKKKQEQVSSNKNKNEKEMENKIRRQHQGEIHHRHDKLKSSTFYGNVPLFWKRRFATRLQEEQESEQQTQDNNNNNFSSSTTRRNFFSGTPMIEIDPSCGIFDNEKDAIAAFEQVVSSTSNQPSKKEMENENNNNNSRNQQTTTRAKFEDPAFPAEIMLKNCYGTSSQKNNNVSSRNEIVLLRCFDPAPIVSNINQQNVSSSSSYNYNNSNVIRTPSNKLIVAEEDDSIVSRRHEASFVSSPIKNKIDQNNNDNDNNVVIKALQPSELVHDESAMVLYSSPVGSATKHEARSLVVGRQQQQQQQQVNETSMKLFSPSRKSQNESQLYSSSSTSNEDSKNANIDSNSNNMKNSSQNKNTHLPLSPYGALARANNKYIGNSNSNSPSRSPHYLNSNNSNNNNPLQPFSGQQQQQNNLVVSSSPGSQDVSFSGYDDNNNPNENYYYTPSKQEQQKILAQNHMIPYSSNTNNTNIPSSSSKQQQQQSKQQLESFSSAIPRKLLLQQGRLEPVEEPSTFLEPPANLFGAGTSIEAGKLVPNAKYLAHAISVAVNHNANEIFNKVFIRVEPRAGVALLSLHCPVRGKRIFVLIDDRVPFENRLSVFSSALNNYTNSANTAAAALSSPSGGNTISEEPSNIIATITNNNDYYNYGGNYQPTPRMKRTLERTTQANVRIMRKTVRAHHQINKVNSPSSSPLALSSPSTYNYEDEDVTTSTTTMLTPTPPARRKENSNKNNNNLLSSTLLSSPPPIPPRQFCLLRRKHLDTSTIQSLQKSFFSGNLTRSSTSLLFHPDDPNLLFDAARSCPYVPLIEKAFAKIYGGYSNLSKGNFQLALETLLGGSATEWQFPDYSAASHKNNNKNNKNKNKFNKANNNNNETTTTEELLSPSAQAYQSFNYFASTLLHPNAVHHGRGVIVIARTDSDQSPEAARSLAERGVAPEEVFLVERCFTIDDDSGAGFSDRYDPTVVSSGISTQRYHLLRLRSLDPARLGLNASVGLKRTLFSDGTLLHRKWAEYLGCYVGVTTNNNDEDNDNDSPINSPLKIKDNTSSKQQQQEEQEVSFESYNKKNNTNENENENINSPTKQSQSPLRGPGSFRMSSPMAPRRTSVTIIESSNSANEFVAFGEPTTTTTNNNDDGGETMMMTTPVKKIRRSSNNDDDDDDSSQQQENSNSRKDSATEVNQPGEVVVIKPHSRRGSMYENDNNTQNQHNQHQHNIETESTDFSDSAGGFLPSAITTTNNNNNNQNQQQQKLPLSPTRALTKLRRQQQKQQRNVSDVFLVPAEDFFVTFTSTMLLNFVQQFPTKVHREKIPLNIILPPRVISLQQQQQSHQKREQSNISLRKLNFKQWIESPAFIVRNVSGKHTIRLVAGIVHQISLLREFLEEKEKKKHHSQQQQQQPHRIGLQISVLTLREDSSSTSSKTDAIINLLMSYHQTSSSLKELAVPRQFSFADVENDLVFESPVVFDSNVSIDIKLNPRAAHHNECYYVIVSSCVEPIIATNDNNNNNNNNNPGTLLLPKSADFYLQCWLDGSSSSSTSSSATNTNTNNSNTTTTGTSSSNTSSTSVINDEVFIQRVDDRVRSVSSTQPSKIPSEISPCIELDTMMAPIIDTNIEIEKKQLQQKKEKRKLRKKQLQEEGNTALFLIQDEEDENPFKKQDLLSLTSNSAAASGADINIDADVDTATIINNKEETSSSSVVAASSKQTNEMKEKSSVVATTIPRPLFSNCYVPHRFLRNWELRSFPQFLVRFSHLPIHLYPASGQFVAEAYSTSYHQKHSQQQQNKIHKKPTFEEALKKKDHHDSNDNSGNELGGNVTFSESTDLNRLQQQQKEEEEEQQPEKKQQILVTKQGVIETFEDELGASYTSMKNTNSVFSSSNSQNKKKLKRKTSFTSAFVKPDVSSSEDSIDEDSIHDVDEDEDEDEEEEIQNFDGTGEIVSSSASASSSKNKNKNKKEKKKKNKSQKENEQQQEITPLSPLDSLPPALAQVVVGSGAVPVTNNDNNTNPNSPIIMPGAKKTTSPLLRSPLLMKSQQQGSGSPLSVNSSPNSSPTTINNNNNNSQQQQGLFPLQPHEKNSHLLSEGAGLVGSITLPPALALARAALCHELVNVDVLLEAPNLQGKPHQAKIGCAVFHLDEKNIDGGDDDDDDSSSDEETEQDQNDGEENNNNKNKLSKDFRKIQTFEQLAKRCKNSSQWSTDLSHCHGVPCLFQNHVNGPAVGVRIPVPTNDKSNSDNNSSSDKSQQQQQKQQKLKTTTTTTKKRKLPKFISRSFLVVPSLLSSCVDGFSDDVFAGSSNNNNSGNLEIKATVYTKNALNVSVTPLT